MDTVYWNGPNDCALLCNGRMLWRGDGTRVAALPELLVPRGDKRTSWYHCSPANLCGDEREQVVLYKPTDRYIWIYTPEPFGPDAFIGYRATAGRYNVRLMD